MSCNQDAFSCSVSSFQDSHAISSFQDSHAILGFQDSQAILVFGGTHLITICCFQDMLNDCISQCQDGVFHADPVFQALVSKCHLFMVWTPQTLPSGHTMCCSLPSASSLPSAQSVCLSVCLPSCLSTCLSAHPTQWSHSVLQPAVRILSAISTVSLSVCLFAFLSVHLSVSLVSTHPTQWLHSMLQPAICIMSALAQSVCLFSVILASWTDSHFGCSLLLCID